MNHPESSVRLRGVQGEGSQADAGLLAGREAGALGSDPSLGGQPGEADALAALGAGDEAPVGVHVALGGTGEALDRAGAVVALRDIRVVDCVAVLAVLVPGGGHSDRGRAVDPRVLEVLKSVGNGAGRRAAGRRGGRGLVLLA